MPQTGELKTADRIQNPVNNGTYSSFDFVETNEKNEVIPTPEGKWKISKDLVVLANKQLEIAVCAHIDLIKGASIISYSPIYAKRQEGLPISLIYLDSYFLVNHLKKKIILNSFH